jgi:hypothetical protein
MKIKIITLITVIAFFSIDAQQLKPETKYRRSSLYTLMINDNSREFANVVKETFIASPIPDKFNDHNLSVRQIDAEAGAEEQDQNIAKFLDSNNVARNMVAKWFNRSKKGAFNMNLVANRGSYNASEMDANKAKMSKRGLALLADAGEELIANSFVLVNDYKYVSKEEIAKYTAVGLQLAGGILSAATGNKAFQTAADVGTVGVAVAGKGYVIKTTSYLYKLVWNDSISAVFYNEYWTDSLSFDPKRKAAFDASKIFKLEQVGSQVAWADLQSTIFTQKSEEELIKIATVRATDAVIAKLQKKYEVFRTKTPLYSVDPLAAKIGLKESLEDGDKFTVLEQAQTEEGKTIYNKIGVIKVDGKNIWDNRHMATADSVKSTDKTLFKKVNGKEFYPGLLIMQK